jgi:hypothetical protein
VLVPGLCCDECHKNTTRALLTHMPPVVNYGACPVAAFSPFKARIGDLEVAVRWQVSEKEQRKAIGGRITAFVESQEVQRTPLEVFVTCKVKNGTKLTHEAKVGGGVQRRRYHWLHR